PESQKDAVDETASSESSAEASEAEEDGPAAEETPSAEPDWKDMYARMLADFDNYRKRVSRDREELVKFAASETVKDMLVTADNLALALGQAKDPEDPFVKGVQLAYESFLKALKDHGAEPFGSVGEELDPNRHEAIATLPSDTVEEGKISTEVKKGWMLNGRLLRAAQVVVSSGPAK
ncbi:MAG: nucleotide exchange factor GrpE, partial [Kiritimatiellae bacterium]|nr:nucleotide exchange factor GrpE [Kiritimatiellia bacterium]